MNATSIRSLHGRTVLVKSSCDKRHPPSALRGTLEVRERDGEPPRVSIALDFPQMFSASAHHRDIVLSEDELVRLLASEREGSFEFTIPDELG
jgi:hypothetical protein